MSNKHRPIAGSLILVVLLFASGCKTTPPKKEDSTAKNDKVTPPVHTVTNGTLKSKAQLDAVLESKEVTTIKINPRTWTDYTIIEAAPHGAKVKKGDVLISCESDKIKEQIADLEQDAPASKLALEIVATELENLKQATPLRLETAKRTHRQADEDYDYFETTGRVQREKNAVFNVKSAEQRLDNATEELTQLEKMYQADDLTEETEEIVLKRQRFQVDAAKLSLEGTRLYTERELKTFLPREHETLQSQKRDQELAFALSEQTLPKNLTKKINDVDKMKRDQKKADKRLADLKHDIDFITVRAPMDGMVYYGASENGKWTTASSLSKRLVPGGKLTGNEILMTVVEPKALVLKGVVQESDLSNFKEGQRGQATPVAWPETKIQVKLEELGEVPMPGGGFEATFSFEPDKSRLVPGMTCKVNLGGSQKADTVLAPKDAVFKEGSDSHVFVVTNGHDPEKRTVKTGNSDERLTEILEGLSKGEKILLKKPN